LFLLFPIHHAEENGIKLGRDDHGKEKIQTFTKKVDPPFDETSSGDKKGN
jgi:hypothetical protein